jgi:hypothetical protein
VAAYPAGHSRRDDPGGDDVDAEHPQPAPRLPGDFKGILRLGLLNYVMLRWAPKNRIGRLAVEMTLLILFFGTLAVLLVLARG